MCLRGANQPAVSSTGGEETVAAGAKDYKVNIVVKPGFSAELGWASEGLRAPLLLTCAHIDAIPGSHVHLPLQVRPLPAWGAVRATSATSHGDSESKIEISPLELS